MPGWLPMRNILRSLPASPCRRGPTRPDESRARHGSRLIARCPALSPSATVLPPSRTAISSRHGSTSLSACGPAAHPRQPKKNAAPMRNASGASAAAAPWNGNFTATLAQCLPAKNNGVHAQPRLTPQLRRRTRYPRARYARSNGAAAFRHRFSPPPARRRRLIRQPRAHTVGGAFFRPPALSSPSFDSTRNSRRSKATRPPTCRVISCSSFMAGASDYVACSPCSGPQVTSCDKKIGPSASLTLSAPPNGPLVGTPPPHSTPHPASPVSFLCATAPPLRSRSRCSSP